MAYDLDPLGRLRELRGTVRCMRQARDEAKAQCKEFHVAYLAASAAAQAQLAECEKDASVAETALREAAEAYYATTGSKNPVAGVGIRLVTKYDYDPTKALAWAIEHRMKTALTLNASGFEALAKAAPGDVPALSRQVAQATIAADLGAVIQAEEQMP